MIKKFEQFLSEGYAYYEDGEHVMAAYQHLDKLKEIKEDLETIQESIEMRGPRSESIEDSIDGCKNAIKEIEESFETYVRSSLHAKGIDTKGQSLQEVLKKHRGFFSSKKFGF